MILRRIAEHLKQQHWTTFAFELAIVVLGVFIGMQADNWNTARKQRQVETELVGVLRANLATSIDLKSSWLKSGEKTYEELKDGIAVVQGLGDSQSLSPEGCSALWRSHIYFMSSSDNPTLIALLSPTGLDVIHDLKLRTALLSYRSDHERGAIFIDRVEDDMVFLPDEYPSAFRRRLDANGGSNATCDLESMRASQALQNKLLSNLGRSGGILDGTRQDLAQLEQLKIEVDAYHP